MPSAPDRWPAPAAHSPRRVHLPGSYPATSTAMAMREMIDRAGGNLARLPDGEVGRMWIAPIIEDLRAHPDLEVRRDGKWQDYGDLLQLQVRRGHRLRGPTLALGYADRAVAAAAVAAGIGARLPLQVGIAGPLDLALFGLGPRGAFRRTPAFTTAVVTEITTIVEQLSSTNVVIQLEIPAEVAVVARTPAALRCAAAALVAGRLSDLVRRVPQGTRFGLHLCVGDLGHKPYLTLPDAGPLAVLANAVAARWPPGRPVEFFPLPLAGGDQPPSPAQRFYTPLSQLRLPVGTRLVAGFLHEGLSVEAAARLLKDIEQAVGATVDVGPACGLGRRPVADAHRILEQAVALCAH